MLVKCELSLTSSQLRVLNSNVKAASWSLAAHPPKSAIAQPSLLSSFRSFRFFAIILSFSFLLEPCKADFQPFSDVVVDSAWQQDVSESFGMEYVLGIRLSGPEFVPFTHEHQEIFLKAAQEVFIPQSGPITFVSYREGYPDPSAPDFLAEQYPYVDVGAVGYDFTANAQHRANWQPNSQAFIATASRTLELGKWPRSTHSIRLLSLEARPNYERRSLELSPVVVLEAILALQMPGGGNLKLEQASQAAQRMKILLSNRITLLRIPSLNSSLILDTLPEKIQQQHQGLQLLLIEVTLQTCQQADTGSALDISGNLTTPDCEIDWLTGRFEQEFKQELVKQNQNRAGVSDAMLVMVRQKPAPVPPSGNTTAQPWVPSHLDRLDQRWLPLDGQYTANATGTGVNVYLISSGIRADHDDFRYIDDGEGTRVQGAWGYRGLNPLQDCPDFFAWYGFGTFGASLIGGLKVGVAKNVTIHSVRFREYCLLDEEGSWTNEGLPAALDYVLANHVKPAVLVIDAWWRRERFSFDDDDMLEAALAEKLHQLVDANVTLVAGSGTDGCINQIASHPSVISVGSSATGGVIGFGSNTSCSDLWALGAGGLSGTIGAYPAGASDYRASFPMLSGGAYIAAGVAAQYLSQNPLASPQQVKQMLLSLSTPDAIIGIGSAEGAPILFSNFTESRSFSMPVAWPVGRKDSAAADDTRSPLTGVKLYVGVPIGAGLISLVVLMVVFIIRRRRARQTKQNSIPKDKFLLDPSSMKMKEWELSEEQIEICLRPDGSQWLLGEGSFGQVFKATKGGVQEVAVKVLQSCRVQDTHRDKFLQEIALMKYVSRDANITQFYGACLHPSMMLVVELMEGGDLRQALTCDHHGVLGWYQGGKSVALDILRGLHFLHEAGVIHRDIKSKNILLTKEGKAKISDVGLAQFLEQQTCSKHESHYYGTLAWAAPELLLGEEFSEKADIYSFGVVLWELVTQEVPLRGALHEPAVPSQCPQQVADAIVACTKRDPSLRPHAKELYAQLRACPPLNFSAAAISLPPVPPGLGHPELLLPSYGSTGSSWLHSCSTSSSPLMRRSPVQQHANAFNSCGHLHGRQLFSELVSQAAGTCNLTEPQLAVPGRSRAEEKAPAGAEACDERTHTDQLAYGQDGHVGISVDKSQTDETKAANAMYVAASAIWRSQPDGSIV